MPRGQKICPQCGTNVAPRVRVCSCGHTFVQKEKPIKTETPAQAASGELHGILDDLFGDTKPQTDFQTTTAVAEPTSPDMDDLFAPIENKTPEPSPIVPNGEQREVQVLNGRMILTPSGKCPVPWTKDTRLHQWIEEIEKTAPEGYQYAGSALRYWLKTVLPHDDYPGLVRLIS